MSLSGYTSGERFFLFLFVCVYWEVGMETDFKFEDEFLAMRVLLGCIEVVC